MMAPDIRKQSQSPSRVQTFVRKADRVSHSGPEQTSYGGFLFHPIGKTAFLKLFLQIFG
jgi:hypothetical protein